MYVILVTTPSFAILTGGFELATQVIWPATIVALALAFRAELRQAMARMSKLKFQGFEAEFKEELARAETLAPPDPDAKPFVSQPRLEMNGGSESRGSTSSQWEPPRNTIHAAWNRLERRAGEASTTGRGVAGLEHGLALQYERLRSLAKWVDRHPEWNLSADDAARFARLALDLERRLNRGSR